MGWILGIAMLLFLVTIHEFGHFLFAKWGKMKVDEFGIGFGPKIFSFTKRETLYSFRLIPLGGFVSPNEESYKESSVRARLFMVLAGPVVNILFCMVAIAVYLLLQGKGFGASLQGGFLSTFDFARLILHGLSELVTGNVPLSQLSGPVGIVDTTEKIVHTDPFKFILWMALVSLNLGIFNLLPIPMLDGGRLLLLTLEACGLKIGEKKQVALFAISALLMVGLFVVGLVFDIQRLFTS